MRATAEDFPRIKPMPQGSSALNYAAEFSPEEFGRIARGLVPKQMEDKWPILYEEPVLHLHRSWTGVCIYQVEFERTGGVYRATQARVNRDRNEYAYTNDLYDSSLLNFLIGGLLLERQVEFPLPAGLPEDAPRGVLQHYVAGTAYPEKKPESRSWWKFW